LLKSGELDSVKIGKARRIKGEALLSLLGKGAIKQAHHEDGKIKPLLFQKSGTGCTLMGT